MSLVFLQDTFNMPCKGKLLEAPIFRLRALNLSAKAQVNEEDGRVAFDLHFLIFM